MTREHPFWGYEDLALFLSAVLPSFALAALAVRTARLSSDAMKTLMFQSLVYALLLGSLYLLISVRYGQPFWRALGWKTAYPGGWLCVVAGPVLAVGVAGLGSVLRAPVVPTPIENLVSDRRSLVIMLFFLAVCGPLFEELVFRGFLFPLLSRSLGTWPGIVLAAVPFALLHGPQYQWTWQHLVLVGLAGVAFGYARYKTESTAASAIVHSGYNVTFFAGFLIQKCV